MIEKRTKYWLLAIFLFTLALRLVLAFYTPNFTYESYFHFRQVESITQTGLPTYHDTLSSGGKDFIFLPLFYYLAALFNLLIPITILAKILPNLLIASLTIIIYLIAKKITNDDKSALIASFTVGLLPVLYSTNSFVPESLFLPLAFLTVYYFTKLQEAKKYLYYYIASFLLLSLTSSAAFLLIMGFGVCLLFYFIENKKINRAEAELIIFSTVFFLWLQLLFYKNIFLKEGISFIWQNIPAEMLKEYFPQVSVASAVLLVSIIPFLAGIYTLYNHLFETKSQKSTLLISLAISTAFLAWLRLIKFEMALSFFGIILSILFGIFYRDLEEFLERTKMPSLKRVVLPVIIALLLLTMVVPLMSTSFNQKIPGHEEILAFQWLKENTPKDAGVLALLEEGHLATYYSQRRNILDDQFILTENAQQRFQDLNDLFKTKFQTHSLGLLEKYRVQYLAFTPKAKEKFQISKFNYAGAGCFSKVYDNETKIYLAKCRLAEAALGEG